MRRPTVTVTPVVRLLALPLTVTIAAILAVALHRNGHTQGDDFALYLRQSRSLFDGDMSQVVADNRFAVLVSDGSFSPIAYPWVWPLLLSPFVHLWGLDYDRLKLVQVAVFCFWLVLLHGIVRRRVGRWVAAALTAVFATAPLYLAHTDQLLSEFTHLAAVALVIWWYDRIRRDATLLSASRGSLVLLGALVTVAFNARRESLVLLGVIGVMVLYDVLADRHGDETVAAGVRRTVEESWRSMITPFAAFAATTALAQLVLPTDLLPDNGNSASFIDDRVGEYPAVLSEQLGLGTGAAPGVILLIAAAAGAVVGVWRRPTLDIPLVALTVLSAMAIGTHFRQVDRYWFQITPWVGYFATVAVLAGATWALARRRRLAVAVAIAPLLALSVAHLVTLRGDIDDVAAFN